MDAIDRSPRWNPTNEDLVEIGDYDSNIRPGTLVEGIDDRKPPGFFESLDEAGATDKELKSFRNKKPEDVLGVDIDNGLHTCPTCGKAGSNPGCGHNFYKPYHGDDSFDFNPEGGSN